ncbi:MAG: toxin [Candidatus Cloacimonetes bacterium]|nr:toxin [Candidatus Cloacimonadota bacterium]
MIAWDEEKNRVLFETRGVSFDDVVKAIAEGYAIADAPHPNQKKYPNQRVLTVLLHEYIHLVPYVIDGDDIFFKTIIPSRKEQRKYEAYHDKETNE